ncbi:uncharacterized protein GGS25DRAFT_516727 [Hypoxylon fragiforme]|uniref:uncharacterized protein n=1 Tax=Hypoxylon fragiforme TaxID=63214 RepID=UPI0020C6633E|nr:uncharacterized protein GGS25DRAFT_516727 [Hypoxylon fragiforme]KAI2613866.1 hypothetical protein GGS25DRAFT_516727 [Hypoxylon fragiforme]
MSPSEQQSPNNQAAQPSGPSRSDTNSVQISQPVALQAMDPKRPQPDQPEFGNMRGGERGSCCPGRFCFCVPCPLPCDCCII